MQPSYKLLAGEKTESNPTATEQLSVRAIPEQGQTFGEAAEVKSLLRPDWVEARFSCAEEAVDSGEMVAHFTIHLGCQ